MVLATRSDIDIEWLSVTNWWSRVDVRGADDCWPWRLSLGSHGYGQTWDGLQVRLAHRVAWSLHYGTQVPEGMTIDHSCHTRSCCNPAHLRVMTNVENATDNLQGCKVQCPAGHPYDATNTYVDPKGHRRCRQCARDRRRHVDA